MTLVAKESVIDQIKTSGIQYFGSSCEQPVKHNYGENGDTPSGNLLTIREVSQVPAIQVSDTADINMKGPGNLGRIKWRHPWDLEQRATASYYTILASFLE
ncbi:hypothetical protein LXL04_031071 [Taraxacum kok-saghyz]